MKKLYSLSALFVLLAAGALIAKPVAEINVTDYDIMDLDFLRTHYNEINDKRSIQIDGIYVSQKWAAPHEYQEILEATGFDAHSRHLVQFTLKEKDDFHYAFPILMFNTRVGGLEELGQLSKGDRVIVYGRFYNLRNSEYMLDVDAVERIRKGGHDHLLVLDSRVAPTPTPTHTITATPGPGLFKKIKNFVSPPETATPTGTITPQPK